MHRFGILTLPMASFFLEIFGEAFKRLVEATSVSKGLLAAIKFEFEEYQRLLRNKVEHTCSPDTLTLPLARTLTLTHSHHIRGRLIVLILF